MRSWWNEGIISKQFLEFQCEDWKYPAFKPSHEANNRLTRKFQLPLYYFTQNTVYNRGTNKWQITLPRCVGTGSIIRILIPTFFSNSAPTVQLFTDAVISMHCIEARRLEKAYEKAWAYRVFLKTVFSEFIELKCLWFWTDRSKTFKSN